MYARLKDRIANKPPGQRPKPEKPYQPYNEIRRSRITMAMVALICVYVIIGVAVCIYDAEQIDDGTEATVVYKGYISNNEKNYPIIERDGKEYISSLRQSVRDNSYVGHAVTIRYDPENPNRFRVLWEIPAEIE